MALDISRHVKHLDSIEPLRVYGKINRIIGLTVESEGPAVSVGELLNIDDQKVVTPLQVIGFSDKHILSMPLGDIQGLFPGQRVFATGQYPGFAISHAILGRVINALGHPLDGLGDYPHEHFLKIHHQPVNAMKREQIEEVVATGVKAIDGLVTIGKGQRMGIFSGSGVGKSTMMGMIARNTSADINVIALIGERGRELKDFIANSLGEEGLKRSVVVATTSDEPPLLKIMAAFTATAIAEFFCDQGMDVLLMMDSVTRMAMAQREVGLSSGEPPSTKGYTPSVFAQMPKLMERAGNFADKGSITGIYTILVEADDVTEPVSDHARSILDGHIVLSRDLAHKNHFPSIDVLGSISRLMNDIASDDQKRKAGRIRELLAVYRDAEDLINIGAYAPGSNAKIDEAIMRIDRINHFLMQGVTEKFTFPQTIQQLDEVLQ